MRTEFLDIPIYEDGELAEILGEPILCREKLHHWPLSYVERVDLAGRSVVVKYAKLSLENLFYSSAEESFLIKPVFMTEADSTSVTILPFVSGHMPSDNDISGALRMIPKISCGVHWLNISSFDDFADLMREAGDIFSAHGAGELRTHLIDSSAKFAQFFEQDMIGYVHGDLKRDNILVTEAGIVIIDWQRPMKAPMIIDKVSAGLENDVHAVKLAKLFETYWLLYAFDRCLYKLPHVLNWAKKYISEIID